MNKQHSVIVIGAGLSGLYAAWRLQQQNIDVAVVDARDRLGGRILSPLLNDHADSAIDLGPAWVWPDLQPRLKQLLDQLELAVFKQYTQGDMLYELDSTKSERYSGQSSHNHSYRIVGGAAALINALSQQLNQASIYLQTQVTAINQQDLTIETLCDGDKKSFTADHIILAMPLRLMHQSIAFTPPLDDALWQQWANTPTWMAGHSKMVFVYDKAFWREQNLSGEVFSRHGPLSEIYDGSPADESSYALTSFVGLNAQQRKQVGVDQLIEACEAQLQRLFGDDSQQMTDIYMHDWSDEPFTSAPTDLTGPAHHPEYPHQSPRSLANNKIFVAGTEAAREHGGYLEGAVSSAEEIVKLITQDDQPG